jgi:hypothetical protein
MSVEAIDRTMDIQTFTSSAISVICAMFTERVNVTPMKLHENKTQFIRWVAAAALCSDPIISIGYLTSTHYIAVCRSLPVGGTNYAGIYMAFYKFGLVYRLLLPSVILNR